MTNESAPDDAASTATADPDAAAQADRAWSLRVYSFVLLSFVLWVVALVVLQRTFS